MTEKFFITSERLEDFKELFKKDVTYDNIESHKKPGFHHLFRRYIFRKTTGEGVGQTEPPPPPAVLGLRSTNKIFEGHKNCECYKPENI